MKTRMTPSELKYQHLQHNPNSHFFDRKTMQFFGDTMRNFGIRTWRNAYELYRKRPVKHGISKSHYFTKDTFAEIHVSQETLAELIGRHVEQGANEVRHSEEGIV